MAPAVERREHIGRRLTDRSMSPVKTRHSPQRRSSLRRERSPSHRRSPERTRSPKRTSSSHKKSPAKEKVPERVKSPKHARGRSPARTSSSRSPSPRTKRLKRAQTEREPEKGKVGEHAKSSRVERNKGGEREFRDKDRTSASRSPSPRSKRLMRAQAERESDKTKEWEHGRNTSREERERGRHGERGEPRDSHSERRSTKDKSDGGSSRSSRRDRSVSPARCDRSVSPEPNHRSKHSSRSPFRVSRDGAREEASRSRTAEQSRDGDVDSIAKMKAAEESLEAKEKDKQKPSYELSGKLAEETNRVRGVTLLFNEPADARKPDLRWRLYVFKSGEVLNEPLYVHRQSCYLFGRERRVADIPTDHPSCSKQHAVIQYRLAEKEQPDGLLSKQSRICNLARELSHLNALVSKHKFRGQHYWDSIAAFCVHHPVKQLHSTWQHRPFDPCYLLLVVKSKDSLSGLPCIFAHLILVSLLQKKELMKIVVLCTILFVIEGSDSMFMIGSFNKLQ